MNAGAQAEVIAKVLGTVRSAGGTQIPVDKSAMTVASVLYDAVFVPGGTKGVVALAHEGDALHFINEAYKHCKPIGAVGEGVDLLAQSDIPNASIPGVKNEGETAAGVVTARDTAHLDDFAVRFIAAIGQHRFWERMVSEEETR